MPRVKRGTMTHKRHKKVLDRAKGYWGGRSRLFKTAKEAVMHSMQYAYRDRRNKKREFRRLWIARINAACREQGMTYGRFIEGLSKAGVQLDRKMLSEMAIHDAQGFAKLVEQARAQVSA
ncbi:MAG TPA: 50S ribosomal protein L20 [Armatimonadota bacterium]|nr:50S ribosomal protein L20 [Armatimonadota bacterium]HOP79489.1 50S ribosomal protein L20 [Armatimonadota bacterium]HPP74656.1 50S ribosomal protein L20 [Armatimonadota bacterium]